MLRLVVLFVQLILASSAVPHSKTTAASGGGFDPWGLKPRPAPTADTGGGLDPWGSRQKPQPAPTADAGGGLDPWG